MFPLWICISSLSVSVCIISRFSYNLYQLAWLSPYLLLHLYPFHTLFFLVSLSLLLHRNAPSPLIYGRNEDGEFQRESSPSADAHCPTPALPQCSLVPSLLLLVFWLIPIYLTPNSFFSPLSLPVSLICKLPSPSLQYVSILPSSINPSCSRSPASHGKAAVLVLFVWLFWCRLLVTVGEGISTSKPVSVPETQQFIYNAFFVHHLSVKPILSLFSPNSTETDRQTACYRNYYNTHNLISASEKNMADGLTEALFPQSMFVVSYQLRMGNRCQWQALTIHSN